MLEIDCLTEKYDNFIFDLYGTLIDIWTDEHVDLTWDRFTKYLDELGVVHPGTEAFRKDFFDLDRAHRQARTDCEYPEIDIIEVYRELFTRYASEAGMDCEHIAGADYDTHATIYGTAIQSDIALNRISYAFREASRIYMRLFPGLTDFLLELKRRGKRIYILSNAQASYTVPEIEYFGLDRIMDDILISSDLGFMKPEKAFFEAMLNKHFMDRSRTLMLGDSYENDYMGALNAGIDGLWLNKRNEPDTDPKGFYLECIKKQELFTTV